MPRPAAPSAHSRTAARRTGRPFADAPENRPGSVRAADDRDDAQDLDVEPDDGHHDAEAADPAVLTGSAVAHALLDRVEVEHERVRRHDHDEDTDDEAERD